MVYCVNKSTNLFQKCTVNPSVLALDDLFKGLFTLDDLWLSKIKADSCESNGENFGKRQYDTG